MSVIRCPECGEVITNALKKCYNCIPDESFDWETSAWDEAGDHHDIPDDNDFFDEDHEDTFDFGEDLYEDGEQEDFA